ncbi:MAG: hypothetical protein J6N45_05660 [Alphaproteobacteria bacterium]|nr:hypothetical protein [Alphaproteobacteria bacterium]
MQWEIEGGAYSVLVTAVNCEAVITPSAPLKVEIGECARIEVESALNYIESGSVEIATAVASGMDTFNEHTTQKTAEFDEHVEDSIACAKNWAVKTDGSVDGEEYSAKYYADKAKNTLLNASNRDLSNLTPIGIAKFTAKQDTLVSGTNIKTINGTSLLGSGDIVIQSAPNLDNKSITKNTADELQTVGVINQNNASLAVKTWTGTKAQYDAIIAKDSGTLYYLTDAQKIYYGNTLVCEKYNRNIGEIITSSIPLTDAGLHLLDGSLIQGGGIYDDFVQYIAGLVNTYPQCFCSEAEWQQSVNTYGVCGKFVYNSTNNTVRLPKITGFIEGTVDSNALGELVEAGLPNHTHYIANYDANGNIDGGGYIPGNSFNVGAVIVNSGTNGESGNGNWTDRGGTGYSMDRNQMTYASSNNSIYGNSSTVQPQSIKVFYYIVVATTTKTDIEVDIDEVITDLNGKANNADVVHKTGNETISGNKVFSGLGTFTNYNAFWKTPYNIIVRSTSIENGVTPSSNQYMGIEFRDKNDVRVGWIGLAKLTDGTQRIELQKQGSTSCFTAPASDASNSIVTTTGINKSLNGYVRLGNGLIIQWGQGVTYGTGYSGTGTTSFSTAFSNSTPVVLTTPNNSDYSTVIAVTETTSTNFKWKKDCNSSSGAGGSFRWIAIGY